MIFALFAKHTVPDGDVAQSRWQSRKAEKIPRLGGQFLFGTIARLTSRAWTTLTYDPARIEYGSNMAIRVSCLANLTPGSA
jgi:hypothetical protein